jgi:hypothetical protein
MKNPLLYRSTRPESGREVRERLLVGGSLEFRASSASGLTEIDNEGVSRIARGRETEASMLCMTLQALVERGILAAAAYSVLQQALLDPSFSFITLTTFAAWGKRAS